LASVGEDQVIQLWDAQNGASLRTIKPNHKYTITSLVFSSDDQFLFSSGLDGNVFAWNAKNGSYYGKAFSNAVGMIWQIAIDQSGRLLAAATNNGAIYFWDLNKWKMYSKPLISNKQENILALRFVDNGKYLISTTESSVSIWQISVDEQGNLGGKEIIQLQFDNYKPIKNLAVDAHEKYLALISPSLTEIPLYSITGLINGQMEGVQFLNGLSDQPVSSVSFNPKNPSQLASGSWDKTIKIWDIKNDLSKNQFLPSKVLEGSEGYVLRVTYSEDGKTLASAGTDNTIRLWNTDDWKQTGNLQGHTQWIRALTFDESGRFLFSAGWDQELRIWDVIHKKLIGNPIKVNEGAFYDLVFYKTGGEQDFLFASSDGTEKKPSLHKWLINSSGQLQAQSSFGPSESTYAISLDPNQKILAAGGKSRVITLWNVENEQQIGAPLIGHQGDILSLSFSPDGKILASGSADNKIILWDMETKMPLGKPLEAHKGFVYSVVFRDDSKILASAGSDGKILLWDVDPQEWIKRACQKAGRNLSAEEWSKFFGNQPYQKTCPTNP
jgi:WD40 repeat protein